MYKRFIAEYIFESERTYIYAQRTAYRLQDSTFIGLLLVKPIWKYKNIYLGTVIAYSTDTLMRQHAQRNISSIYFFTL